MSKWHASQPFFTVSWAMKPVVMCSLNSRIRKKDSSRWRPWGNKPQKQSPSAAPTFCVRLALSQCPCGATTAMQRHDMKSDICGPFTSDQTELSGELQIYICVFCSCLAVFWPFGKPLHLTLKHSKTRHARTLPSDQPSTFWWCLAFWCREACSSERCWLWHGQVRK